VAEVYIPQRRSALDTVIKGLNAAQTVVGIKSEWEQSKLREQQERLNEQRLTEGEFDFEEKKRKSWLSKAGVIPEIEFNEKYFEVDNDKLDSLQDKYKDYPFQPITMKVSVYDPEEKQNKFRNVLAIDRDDLVNAQKYLFDQKKMIALSQSKAAQQQKPTTGAFSSAGFAERMTRSNSILDQLEQAGFDRASAGTATQAGVLGMAGEFGEFFKSEDLKLYEQAKQDFILAQLRDESGAAIGTQEYKDAEKIYFPQAGDSPQVVAQKRLSRQIALKNMQREAQFYGLNPQQPSSLINLKSNNSLIEEAIADDKAKETDDDFMKRYIGGP